MAEHPWVQSVGALLVNPAGKGLLQQRDDQADLPYAGHWTTLGGAVEAGETPDEAMRRELLEEIEIAPELRLWKGFKRESIPRNGRVWNVEQYIYTGAIDLVIGEIRLNEGQALGFFGRDEIDRIPIAFDFATVFKEFFESLSHD